MLKRPVVTQGFHSLTRSRRRAHPQHLHCTNTTSSGTSPSSTLCPVCLYSTARSVQTLRAEGTLRRDRVPIAAPSPPSFRCVPWTEWRQERRGSSRDVTRGAGNFAPGLPNLDRSGRRTDAHASESQFRTRAPRGAGAADCRTGPRGVVSGPTGAVCSRGDIHCRRRPAAGRPAAVRPVRVVRAAAQGAAQPALGRGGPSPVAICTGPPVLSSAA